VNCEVYLDKSPRIGRSCMTEKKKRSRRSGGMILKIFFFLAPSLLLGIKACFAV